MSCGLGRTVPKAVYYVVSTSERNGLSPQRPASLRWLCFAFMRMLTADQHSSRPQICSETLLLRHSCKKQIRTALVEIRPSSPKYVIMLSRWLELMASSSRAGKIQQPLAWAHRKML
mmetsp:Transcript_54285/g.127555  ORF Transcript_54285/g.127555 Transcript_54285/m.127555 type:complete len:117 (+) Transcript_54285:543-893(+)